MRALRPFAFLLLSFLLLSGCANIGKPVPDGYTGPLATVADSVYQETGSKGRIFALVEVDGTPIETSFEKTRRASSGQGFSLSMVQTMRSVPARPMSVKLYASHVTAAPIHAIAARAAGTYFDVEGVVSFTPKPNVHYIVRGELQSGSSKVWIEEDATGNRVTEVVAGK